jgi:hypothetical protein
MTPGAVARTTRPRPSQNREDEGDNEGTSVLTFTSEPGLESTSKNTTNAFAPSFPDSLA